MPNTAIDLGVTFGRLMNESLGVAHFILTFVCYYATFFPMHLLGLRGQVRRVYDPYQYELLKPLESMNAFVTWAAVVAIMAHGVSAGHEMLEDIRHPVASSNLDWETPARNAGLTQEQIAEIRAKVPANNRTENVAAGSPEARRALWFTFAGIWLSMAAAALGAYVGAGPTFRLAVRTRATVAGIQ